MLGYMAENILQRRVRRRGGRRARRRWWRPDGRSSTCARRRARRGAIAGAVNPPLDDLRRDLDDLGAGPVLVFCEVGQRGHTATALLHELGLEARNLDGGYRAWSLARRAAELARRGLTPAP